MRVLLSMCGSRGAVEPMAGLAAQLRTLGPQVRRYATPGCAAAEAWDAPVAADVMPTGGWR